MIEDKVEFEMKTQTQIKIELGRESEIKPRFRSIIMQQKKREKKTEERERHTGTNDAVCSRLQRRNRVQGSVGAYADSVITRSAVR